jgi:protease-4
MERPRVEELATGWTWSGEKALDLGLVDQIGTHRDALDSAARAGGIDGDYDIVTYDDDYGAWLRSLLRLTAAFERISAAVGGQAVPSARGVIPR